MDVYNVQLLSGDAKKALDTIEKAQDLIITHTGAGRERIDVLVGLDFLRGKIADAFPKDEVAETEAVIAQEIRAERGETDESIFARGLKSATDDIKMGPPVIRWPKWELGRSRTRFLEDVFKASRELVEINPQLAVFAIEGDDSIWRVEHMLYPDRYFTIRQDDLLEVEEDRIFIRRKYGTPDQQIPLDGTGPHWFMKDGD